MEIDEVIAGVGLGLIGGYVGTQVLERVSMKLYEWEPEEARRQEDAVRPGPPFQIAAEKTARVLGITLNEDQLNTASLIFHYGAGMSWGPVYSFLRQRTAMSPLRGGFLTGASMSLILDEGLTPALGFSAPNRAYPLVTHVRGFVAHLAFGLGVAATVEVLTWMGRTASRNS